MEPYIDKNALLARIKKLKMDIGNIFNEYDEGFWEGRTTAFDDVICELDTLEVKEIEDLQSLEKEVAEGYVGLVNKKRVPIELKGELKAKFKNEFNTLWQTVNRIDFANVAKPIIERICLNFAAWGFYNLSKIGDVKGNKEIDSIEVKEEILDKEDKTKLMQKCVHKAYKRGYDTGVLQTTNKMNHNTKEVDLEEEVDKWYNNEAPKEFENVLYEDIEKCAKHFFELGLSISNESQKGE